LVCLLPAGGDVGVEVVAVDADVLAELDDGDTSFGTEASDEAGGGAGRSAAWSTVSSIGSPEGAVGGLPVLPVAAVTR
jgi:hypothetical protein